MSSSQPCPSGAITSGLLLELWSRLTDDLLTQRKEQIWRSQSRGSGSHVPLGPHLPQRSGFHFFLHIPWIFCSWLFTILFDKTPEERRCSHFQFTFDHRKQLAQCQRPTCELPWSHWEQRAHRGERSGSSIAMRRSNEKTEVGANGNLHLPAGRIWMQSKKLHSNLRRLWLPLGLARVTLLTSAVSIVGNWLYYLSG